MNRSTHSAPGARGWRSRRMTAACLALLLLAVGLELLPPDHGWTAATEPEGGHGSAASWLSASRQADDGDQDMWSGSTSGGTEAACNAAVRGTAAGLVPSGSTDRYVDAHSGADEGECTAAENPCRTIRFAVDRATDGDSVLVAEGTYTVGVPITVTRPIRLVGGFARGDWSRRCADPCSRSCMSEISGSNADGALPLLEVTGVTSGAVTIDGFRVTAGKGGGMRFTMSRAEVANSRIEANRGSYFGGVWVRDGSAVTITRTAIVGNSANGPGHAGLLNTARSTTKIDHSTIANNAAVSGHNGLFCGIGWLGVTNSIIWGHQGTDFVSGSWDYCGASHSIVEMDLPVPPHKFTHTIQADPQFVDGLGLDVRLRAVSPAIDAGDPLASRDWDNTRADMGMCPFSGSLVSWTRTRGWSQPFLMGVYLPVTEAYGEEIDCFNRLTGRPHDLVSLYTNWEAPFPHREVATIRSRRAAPLITWEPWTATLGDIAAGAHDDYIREWARALGAIDGPVYVRWAHEANGDWYPWGGASNGGAEPGEYGDPSRPDGPERYVDAYRRIVGIFREEGAQNAVWVWSVNRESLPDEAWNSAHEYFPGRGFAQWVALSGFDWGDTAPWRPGCLSFDELFGEMLRDFGQRFPGLPQMIAEFATACDNGCDRASWIATAFAQARSYPDLRALVWLNKSGEEPAAGRRVDWRLNCCEPCDAGPGCCPGCVAAYHTGATSPCVGRDASWHALDTIGQVPAAAAGHSAVIDEASDRMIVYGVAPFSTSVYALSLGETPARWRKLDVAGDAPTFEGGQSAVVCGPGNRLILWGGKHSTGDVFALDLTPGAERWSTVPISGTVPHGRTGHSAVCAGDSTMLIHGGYVGGPPYFLNDTWMLTVGVDGGQWTELRLDNPPPRRAGHTAVYDAATNRMLIVSGTTDRWGRHGDVWQLDLSAGEQRWSLLQAECTRPLARTASPAAFDTAFGLLVMFGGDGEEDLLRDTIALQRGLPPTWHAVRPTNANVVPDARHSHSLVFDARRRRFVLFGGIATGPRNDVHVLTLSPYWLYLPTLLVSTPPVQDIAVP